MAGIHVFPTPFPDETIASLVCRYYQLAGGLGVRRTLVDLFGVVTKAYGSDLPCHLAHLEAVLGCEQLVDEHTLLPYFSPFLTAEKKLRARQFMQGRESIGLKMELGITAAGFEKFNIRRYCPRCVATDFAYFGVSYWHVSHHAAGVHVCPKHHCYLHRVLPEVGKGTFNQFILPGEVVRRGTAEISQALEPEYFSTLSRLSNIIHWGISNPQSIVNLLCNDYLHYVLNRAGLISKGRVCASNLDRHFCEAASNYPSRFEFLQIFASTSSRLNWPFDLLRRRQSSHHPLLFYMFLNCLDIDEYRLAQDSKDEVVYHRVCPPKNKAVALDVSVCDLFSRRASFINSYAENPAKKSANYMWLYRHDKLWLQSYIATHKTKRFVHDIVDWGGRDRELAILVSDAVFKIRSLPSFPVKISLASICRSLVIPQDSFRNKLKIPLTTAVLASSLESLHDYQCRKLEWAVKMLDAQNIECTRSNLMRRSNIRVLHLSEEEVVEITCRASEQFRFL
ncbi:TnsD family transposase [Pseudomonas silvicola]|nr:TnsD family transposase [Pseudomonas silvicola]